MPTDRLARRRRPLRIAPAAAGVDRAQHATSVIELLAGVGVPVRVQTARRVSRFDAHRPVSLRRVRAALGLPLRRADRPRRAACSRPRARRRTGASSRTSGSDPGGGDPEHEPKRASAPRSQTRNGRHARPVGPPRSAARTPAPPTLSPSRRSATVPTSSIPRLPVPRPSAAL